MPPALACALLLALLGCARAGDGWDCGGGLGRCTDDTNTLIAYFDVRKMCKEESDAGFAAAVGTVPWDSIKSAFPAEYQAGEKIAYVFNNTRLCTSDGKCASSNVQHMCTYNPSSGKTASVCPPGFLKYQYYDPLPEFLLSDYTGDPQCYQCPQGTYNNFWNPTKSYCTGTPCSHTGQLTRTGPGATQNTPDATQCLGGPNGARCNVNDGCASGYCTGSGGTCQRKRRIGESCFYDDTCESGYCRWGFFYYKCAAKASTSAPVMLGAPSQAGKGSSGGARPLASRVCLWAALAVWAATAM